MKKKLVSVSILLAIIFILMWILGGCTSREEIEPEIVTPIPDKEIETDWLYV